MDQKETDVVPKEEVKEKKPEKLPPEIEALTKELEGIEKVDEKVRHVLSFMRRALTEDKEAQLGLFWKGRTKCMELFKEPMAQATRSVLWTEYLELVQEARRIKEVLDEASAFAVEQIEIAIKALEENLQEMPELLKQTNDIDLPKFVDREALTHRDIYRSVQKELTLLNSFASRVQALRKEVIHTGMRLKIKNRFFVRLSACGDLVFPKRRELIKKISDAFLDDVVRFVDAYFKSKTKEAQNYVLREEIKRFQDLAKTLTLNTAVFSQTRKELSASWDILKESDKERKKEQAQKKDEFKKNVELVREKITPFAEKCSQEGVDKKEVKGEAEEILAFMRTVELARDDVNTLKDEIKKAQAPIFEKEKAEAEAKRREREEAEAKRAAEARAYIDEFSALLQRASSVTYDELKSESERLGEAQGVLSFDGREKREVEGLFDRLAGVMSQKFEEAVFSKEGSDDFESELRELLAKRQEERQQSKSLVEALRKKAGGSGLDFEQAMQLREQFEAEKGRLEQLVASIEKIEDQLDRLS